MKKLEEVTATGRRKTAVAAVRLRKGSGSYDVNGRKLEEYFPVELQRKAVLSPLSKLGLLGQYDLILRVEGGGIEGQATAARLGIARALVAEAETRRDDLRQEGFLTRDARRRERKKYGQKGARKRFQYSKR